MHCSLRVQTPGAGRYRLRLTLVQVHVAWFDEIDLASVADATVEVVAGRR
jgi:DNA-binding IclR family transcriptional regulator